MTVLSLTLYDRVGTTPANTHRAPEKAIAKKRKICTRHRSPPGQRREAVEEGSAAERTADRLGGVIARQCSVETRREMAENIVVESSHLGLGRASGGPLRDRRPALAQREGHW